MSDCDVCIGGGFDGETTEFYHSETRTARRVHKCCECHQDITRGQQYEAVVLKYEGEIMRYKTCLLCVEIRTVFTCGESWIFETLWHDMRALAFERLTTASPCFTKLSASAKDKVLKEWRAWKFRDAS